MHEFALPTMTCGHCVRAVTEAVHAVDPDAGVEIDLAAHRVQIDSAHGAERFAAALTEEGYAPSPEPSA